MVVRDKYGWPVECIKGRPITNIYIFGVLDSFKPTRGGDK